VWTRLPDVPVIVRVADPAVAVGDAVRVRMLVLVVLAGLKDAVTPAGRPLTARLTAPLKPLRSSTVVVLVPLLPWMTLTDEADSEKSGAGVTVRAMVVVCVRLPEMPVTVTVAGPTVAVADAVKVRMLVPVVLAGLKAAVTPAGRPLADKATEPVKLLRPLTVMVLEPVLP